MKNANFESLAQSGRLAKAVADAYRRRVLRAQERFSERMEGALGKYRPAPAIKNPWQIWEEWFQYGEDALQRSVLFWDTLRQRGNNFLEHEWEGQPPLLHFDYEIMVDGRKLDRTVNYALVRIIPPKGVTVDSKRRPYVIIDPRAGHGPGIGGFKDDSQVGVALEDGHPVYFVIFFPEPEPGQTLLDVCDGERQFIHEVRERHPDSAAPVVIGNCQGGWAAMMLASSAPEDTGPIVINGAPLSYWGGAWSEDEGDNPMRYTGGLLGGSWMASWAADLGGGKFDGADLVQNFENLNPANTFWEKYYNLYSKVDTERERFLDFERWWGGFYLLNDAEINWIVHNLFVGNKLATGGGLQDPKRVFRSAFHPLAGRGVRVHGGQHHPSAAGVQLDRRPVREHRGDQSAGRGDRRASPRGRGPPGHLRLRPRCPQGAQTDRLRAQVHRGPASWTVGHGDPRGTGARREPRLRRLFRGAQTRRGGGASQSLSTGG